MPLKEIAELLAGMGTHGRFAIQRKIPIGDLKLEVERVGPIRLPITAATARKLCAVAGPAHHGYKDQTRLDRRVRDTLEISKNQISVEPLTKKALAADLDHIRRDLGMPDGCRLKAQLHNLLIYGPGQFFATHQDSEKSDDMIGTLVVSLPSRFTGGEMLIEHHDERMRVGGSETHLTLAAFYGDCRHEIRPVKSGYRAVLTYNLLVQGQATASSVGTAPNIEALTRRVRAFFERPSPPRWPGDRERGTPDRLVYLLDHEYTQRGLAWNRLKGADAQRVVALQGVAERLDCEISLALADVHETWACEQDAPGYGYGHREWGYDEDQEDEDEDDAGSGSEPELTDLIDRDVELRHWVDRHGKTLSRSKGIGGGVSDHELCYTKPSVEFEPFESEHEGYMGNYGNTVDRWYHRAAIVLWPQERTFVIRAKQSPGWALREIAKLLKAGEVTQAAAQARRLLPFWPEACGHEDRTRLLGATLKVAAGVDDAHLGAALLEPFSVTNLAPKLAPRLADVLDRYGVDWCQQLLRHWLSDKKHGELPETRVSWLGDALPPLCRTLCDTGSSAGQQIARWMLREQWSWLSAHMKSLQQMTAQAARVKEFRRLCQTMLGLIESSLIADEADLHEVLIECLTESTTDLPIQLPVGVLRVAGERHRAALPELGLGTLHARCTQELRARLEAPARGEKDWSIATSVGCSCKLCTTLNRFLRTPDTTRFEWPLAKDGRAHVHRIIDAHDLTVRHTTRRTGRPFTLVLEKTAALFEREAAERLFWKNELAWLTGMAGEF